MDNSKVTYNSSSEINASRIYWEDIQNKPAEYPVEYHTHSEYAKRYHKHSIEDISDVDSFATADHLHDDRYFTKEEVEGKFNAIDFTVEVDWNDLLNKPNLFPPANHIHDEFYTKAEIREILRGYSPLGHTHVPEDIEGVENLPGNGGNGGSNNDNAPSDRYLKFVILRNYWTETSDGLYSCIIEHNLNTKDLDAVARYNNGAYALVDIECEEMNELIITAIDDSPLVLFVKKITT